MPPVTPGSRQTVAGYALAVVGPALATGVDLLLKPLIFPSVTPPFVLAVAVASLYGGVGPGALASLLSLAALSYWFFPPFLNGELGGTADLVRQLMFLLVAAVVAWMGGMAQRQRGRALAASEEAARALSRQLEAEADLRRSADAAARFAAIVANSNDAIIGKTLDGVITSWNAAAERIFGYPAAEMVGQSVFKLIPEELHDSEREVLRRLRKGEAVESSEAERIRRTGERIWISLSVSPIRNPEGDIVGAASIKRDITERRLAEAELRRHQDQLRLAHQAARMGAWRWDVAGNRLTWDEGLRRIYGLGPTEDVAGYDDFLQRVHPDDRERIGRRVNEALEGTGAVDYEFRIVLPDGGVRWLADLGRVSTDAAGRPEYVTGICMDITERKLMEEHLRDSQRLQSTGQLAGGIAHEANNQMSVVLGAAHFLLRRPDLPEAARQDIDQIRQAAERTAGITQQLLAFSRRQVLQLRQVDLNAVTTAIVPVLRRTLSETHELVLELGPLTSTVRADSRQLDQALLNLVLNARDAMPSGGRVTVATSEVVVSREDARREDGPPPGRFALLTVEDSGHGMERATLERAFEPFFTTKGIGQGTGLGLSVVHGIVNQLGGTVRVESHPGRGTRFELFFPLEAAPAKPSGSVDPPVPEAVRDIVALVVEDDPLVRRMVSRSLEEAGYRTLEAENGQSALDLIRRGEGRLDLVVTDIGMPVLNGLELATVLERERPELAVMFISGYGDEVIVRESSRNGVRPVLRKPFSPDELVRHVGDLLRAQRAV